MKKIYFLILAFVIFFANAQTEAVLVLNEGGAGSNNAEISLISNQSVTNNYFKTHNNNAALGDTAQDIKIYGDRIFVVLNISNQIKVINKSDFSLITTISANLDNPRYIAFSGNKFYVTNWGGSGSTENYVAVYDLNTYTHETNIPVGSGPEKIYSKDNRLYVLLKGGFGINQFMDVINTSTNTVESEVNVGDFPHSIFEKDQFLYIMSFGNPYTSNSYGTFTVYNTVTQSTVSSTAFPAGTKPSFMDTDGTNIYYMKDASIYKTPIAAPSFSTTPIATAPITVTGYGAAAYGFNIVNNTIYVADPKGYIAPGKIYTYDLQGTLQNTFTVTMLPNQIIAYNNSAPPSLSTVENTKASKLSLYPNPANSKFFVQGLNSGNIQVYDANGRKVINAQYTQNGIDINTLPKGTYIVKITDKSTNFTEKLIIK
ncbi:hypothetical protein HX13_14090 [Chryseobacterium sp. P1-3]|uniref:YncE family protein n=1 Tax=Chryseobacterium sp. (strain P1-3) TaxID=1517683 RepID=UPI0004E6B6C4|nr:T9SS type A sorting domain-containing protein [Chryseobacterium sp. P1-3]KFF74252.1 hypothetical protein HX13_14090 [Chryseobacterium sp. P1-3]